ncbi:MAG: immunoglobulin-like domain-containing protein, partial [bacterium]
MKKASATILCLLFAFVLFACETVTTTTTGSTTGTTTTAVTTAPTTTTTVPTTATTTATTATTTVTTTTVTTTTVTTTSQTTTTTATTTAIPDETDPLILGAHDQIVNQGDDWDPLAGVSAIDDRDGTITANIVVTGTYDLDVIGYYTITYTVQDQAGNTATVDIELRVKAPEIAGFNIVNGDFSEVLELPWGHWAGDGGASSVAIVDGVLNYVVTAIGNVTYSNQFSQTGRTVENGKIYQLTFRAKADLPRPMIVSIEDPSNGYMKYLTQTVDLTTEWVTYTIYIFVTNPSMTTGKLGFFLGRIGTTSVPTTVYLDDVLITELTEAPADITAPVLAGVGAYVVELGNLFDPLNGVTVTDDLDLTLTVADIIVTGIVDVDTLGVYNLTYSVTDAGGNTAIVNRQITVSDVPPASTWLIPNGDFAVDVAELTENRISDNWGWHANTGQMTAKIEGGSAVINIINIGSVEYGIQFYLLNRVVEQGRTYQISFQAKADTPRYISLVLENGVGGTRQFDIDFYITTEWQTFTFTYYQANPTITAGKFAFFAGSFEGLTSAITTLYLDNVSVTPVTTTPDTVPPVLSGVENKNIEQNDAFDPLFGVIATDARDASISAADIIITGAELVDTAVLGEYTVTYSVTDASGNNTTIVRTITVIEPIGASPWVVINGDFSQDQLIPFPSGQGWGWHGNGSFNVTIASGVAKIDVYDTWTLYYGVQFYLMNRELIQGQTYLISFRAKADDPRPIQMSIESSGAKFNAYFDLTTDWVTYTYEYTHTTASFTNGKFAFFLGNIHDLSVPTTVYLDDVVVSRITNPSADVTPPQIWGAMDYYIVEGNAFDPLRELRVYDHVDKVLTAADIVVISNDVNPDVPGVYTVEYTLTDASGNTLSLTRTVTVITEAEAVACNIVFTDGDFSLEAAITNLDANPGWTLKTGGTVAGSFDAATFVDGAVRINVLTVGSNPHSIQFFQRNGFMSPAGSMYVLSFRAKADVARDIRVSFEETTNWAVLSFHIVPITTEWATYELVLYNKLQTHPDVKFGFFLGLIDPLMPERSAATAIYFDDVELRLIGYAVDTDAPVISAPDVTLTATATVYNALTGVKYGDAAKKPIIVVTSANATVVFDPATGLYNVDISVVGVYTLTYTVTDIYGNVTVYNRTVTVIDPAAPSSLAIINGDFAIDQAVPAAAGAGWGWHGSGSFDISIAEGVAKIDIYDTWTLYYGVQFYILNRAMNQGETYLISFRAKANDPRPLQMAIESSGAKFTAYFDLTTDWVTYTFEYTHTTASFTNGKFAFFLGNIHDLSVPTTVYLDDVVVTRINAKSADATAPQIWGVMDYYLVEGNVFDPLLGIRVYDHYDKSITAADVTIVSNDVNPDVPGVYTVVYQLIDSSNNKVTITRTVTVITEAEAVACNIVFTDGDFSLEAAITNLDANPGW